MSVLNDINSMTKEQLAALLEQARAENEALKRAKPSGGLKISAKGALSVYGLGRFPVTLYKSQWIALISQIEAIKAFISAHESELKDKGDEA